MKHFPDDIFNFLKQNYELATVTKLFSCKRRVVSTPYLRDLQKVEIFTIFCGSFIDFLPKKLHFFKMPDLGGYWTKVGQILSHILPHVYNVW